MGTRTPPRVIVGIDSSPAGLRALRTAVDEARRRRAELYAVRVWRLDAAPSPSSGLLSRELQADAARLVADAFEEALGGVPDDIEVRALTMGGHPGPALVECAQNDDDLLVVGSTQRPWWHRLLRRRVGAYCAAHASCAVLVLPPTAFARQARRGRLVRSLRRDLASMS